MKISACCIIKNEEKNLPRYIDGIKDIADEIITVDTGSNDNSVPLLEDLKTKYNLNLTVYNFKWIDDFSAAKNFAMSKADGDWIIFLDADEYFEENDAKKLRSLIENVDKDKSMIGIYTLRQNIDTDNHNLPTSSDTVMRVFRNLENYRYKGEIHEYMDYEGDEIVSVFESNLTVMHTGYSKKLLKAKNERNKKLILSSKFKNETGRITYNFYLAVAYFMEKNYKEAEKNIKKAITVMKKADYYFLIDCYRLYIKIKEAEKRPYKEIDALITDGLKFIPNHPDFLTIRMVHLLETGDFEEVEKICRIIFEKAKDKALRKKYVNKIDFELPYVHYSLGICHIMKNNLDSALKEFLTALKSYRYRDYFLKNTLSLLAGDEKRALTIINEYYDVTRDREFLNKVLKNFPNIKL